MNWYLVVASMFSLSFLNPGREYNLSHYTKKLSDKIDGARAATHGDLSLCLSAIMGLIQPLS